MAVVNGFFGKGRGVFLGRSLASWLWVLVMVSRVNGTYAQTKEPLSSEETQRLEDSILASYGLDRKVFKVSSPADNPKIVLNPGEKHPILTLSWKTFNLPVILTDINYFQSVQIVGCEFKEGLILGYLDVKNGFLSMEGVTIKNSIFHKNMELGDFISRDLEIIGCEFVGELTVHTIVLEELLFLDTKCQSMASFVDLNSYYVSLHRFLRSEFTFRGVDFNGGLIFAGCDFSNSSEGVFSDVKVLCAENAHGAFKWTKMPEILDLDNVIIEPPEGVLNFKTGSTGRQMRVIIRDVNPAQVTFDYATTELQFMNYALENLMISYKKFGEDETKEGQDALKYRIEREKHFELEGFEKVIGDIEFLWWGYGYRRGNIIWFTMILFGVCWFWVYVLYTGLSRKVYVIDNLKYHYPNDRSAHISNGQKAFFYTLFLFFGLSVKLDKLRFDKPRYVYFLLFVYLLGLFCTASVITYVVSL